jgi:transcription initiation factor IIF auxiliary subunit
VAKIKVEHEVLKKRNRIRFRKFRKDGYDHFKIRLYISGPLQEINYVEYELHSTFREPVRISDEREAGFPIEFWTWGEFEILVTAHYIDGHVEELTYYLEYSSELPDTAAAYYDETPTRILGDRDV